MLEQSPDIRILIVDDHPIVRDGLAAVLRGEDGFCVVGQASSGDEARRLYEAHKPDVTLMDLEMPGMGGIEAISAIRKDFPGARFIVLTVYMGEEDIYRAFQAGAQAYLLKDAPEKEILDTIRLVAGGGRRIPPFIASRLAERVSEPELTPRESEALALLAQGKSNTEIARRLGITPRTAKAHVKSILSKLGAKNRTEAVSTAVQRGYLHLR